MMMMAIIMIIINNTNNNNNRDKYNEEMCKFLFKCLCLKS